MGGDGVTSLNEGVIAGYSEQNGLTVRVITGELVPGLNEPLRIDSFLGTGRLSDSGELVFAAELKGDSTRATGIFSQPTGAAFSPIAIEGQPAMAVGPDVQYGRVDLPAINSAGNFAFVARLFGIGTSEQNDQALFSNRGGRLRPIARFGDTVLDGSTELSIRGLLAPELNEHGQILVRAFLREAGQVESKLGILLFDTNDRASVVVREGGAIDSAVEGASPDVKTIRELAIGRYPFNDRGEVAFGVIFSDFDRGVYVSAATAIPEPNGALFGLLVLVAFAFRRRI